MVTLVFLLKDAFRPLRHAFPDDCDIVVGRGGEAHTVTVTGDRQRFEVRAPAASLSEHHATLTVRDGHVTVVDHGSRNGTFQRIDAGRARPLEAPLWFGSELSLQRDDTRWNVPTDFDPLTAEQLAAVLRDHLQGRGLTVSLGGDDGHAWAITGDTRLLTVRPSDPSRTVSGDDLTWVRLVVNAYNTAVATRRTEARWHFTAVSAGRTRALQQCRRAAPTRLPVLLLGPTGVGKDVLAQGLHNHGPCAQGPFVALNCAELSPERLGSELFGHVRGAFTGATADHAGLIETASGGTLFLDEIGEMPEAVQAMLLRFLESEAGEYRRMGDTRLRRARVRIVAATHRDLTDPSCRFRRDLYHRLAGVVVDVPPPTPDDLRVIARELFQQRAGTHTAPTGADLEAIAAEAARHRWPGGVRGLRQAVDRCLQMRDPTRSWADNWRLALEGERLSHTALPPRLGALDVQPAAVSQALSELIFLSAAREPVDRTELARRLGMTYQGVHQRLKSLGLAHDDRAAIDRRAAETTATLRALVANSPGLAALLRALLDG